ncbi:TPA: hypothetical protein ACH3X3_014574 [Trebouxia sp. C0006]
MSSPQSPALQEAFNTFDEDGSGFVDLQELIRCLRSLNVNHVTDAQIERRFKEADVDGSGAIDFVEFYGLWFSLTRPNEVTLQEVKDILRKRVVDRTGAQLQRLAKFLQQKQPFFQQLQPEVVRDVARFLLYDHIKAGTILMKQGDKGDHMYIILSGQANIHIANTTSFKNVVHAIQHTRLLAKLVSGNAASRALAEASSSDSAIQSQGSLVKEPSTAQLSRNPSLQMKQEEVQVPVKEDTPVTQPAANASANVMVPDPQTTSISAQAGDAVLAKADAGRKTAPSRLSRFGQDSLAASPSTAPEVKVGTDAALEQPSTTGVPGQSTPVQTPSAASAQQPGGKQSRLSGKGIGRLVASLGPGDALGEMALLKQGGLRTATVQATTDCEVIIMHRSIFESLMRTLKGHLLYQAEYLSRLLVKPPTGRSEADVLKLASYLTSLQRFQEVPQPKLVQLAKEVTYAELAVGTVICRQGDDGDCMYIILRGSCNVHVDPDFDETAQAGALQKASLQPKLQKKKQPAAAGLTAKHLLRPGTSHLERLSSTASTRSDMSVVSTVTASSRRSTESHDGHPRKIFGEGSVMSKGRAIAAAMAGAIDGESSKLTDDQVVLLEQQYGPLDRNLPTGGSFGELSLADSKLARRNATIIAAEPASLIRIDKQLYRKTLYEMQLTATAEKLAFLRQVPIFEGSNSRQLTQMHFVLEKCTVQRGHIIILEGQPCAGMFFIVTGQVSMLAQAAASSAAPEADGEGESMPDEAADMQATRWGGVGGAAMSWWGLNGRDGQAAGRLPGVTGKFQQVAILGPAEFIGEVVASKHKFTAVAECECNLLWLKPQELHMLGSKSLGLAMQYSALRETRWQQHQKAASLLPHLHSMLLVKQGTSATTSSGKRSAKFCCMLHESDVAEAGRSLALTA